MRASLSVVMRRYHCLTVVGKTLAVFIFLMCGMTTAYATVNEETLFVFNTSRSSFGAHW